MVAVTDVTSLWDFADPAGSEQRFRAAVDIAEGSVKSHLHDARRTLRARLEVADNG